MTWPTGIREYRILPHHEQPREGESVCDIPAAHHARYSRLAWSDVADTAEAHPASVHGQEEA